MGKRLPSGGNSVRGGTHLALALVVALLGWLSATSALAHGEEKHARPSASAEAVDEAGHEGAGHEHAPAPSTAHAYPPEGVPKPLAWLGKFHPVATHFPVALLTVAALAELLLLRKPEALLRHAVRFCVWGGAIGAVIAAPLGWFFAGFRLLDDEWVMTAHRWAGTATALWALAVLYVLERCERAAAPRSRSGFRAALFVGAGLVGATGFLGGAMIYGIDHYAW